MRPSTRWRICCHRPVRHVRFRTQRRPAAGWSSPTSKLPVYRRSIRFIAQRNHQDSPAGKARHCRGLSASHHGFAEDATRVVSAAHARAQVQGSNDCPAARVQTCGAICRSVNLLVRGARAEARHSVTKRCGRYRRKWASSTQAYSLFSTAAAQLDPCLLRPAPSGTTRPSSALAVQ